MTLALARRSLCLLPLVGAASAAAQPRLFSGPELKARSLVLPDNPTAPAPTVRAAPGYVTVLEFDASIDPDSLSVEGRQERFALVEATTRTVVLRPALALPEDTPLLLTVDFADGLTPSHATLALVPATGEVDAQVRVIRRPRSVPALESELEAVLARCEAGNLAKLALSGELRGGVTLERLPSADSSSEVKVLEQNIYRTLAHAVVAVELELAPGARPWTPGEAWLRDAAGQVLRRLPVWMDGTRLQPGESRSLAVELERPSAPAEPRWRVELRERDGERHMALAPFTP
ncbi:DUF2381 family protein [Archangium sp.]|uniref:DUF2381 family protein n=1 Tax=Archangium sp. TaxID=1872627 RepID=UPI00389B22F3